MTIPSFSPPTFTVSLPLPPSHSHTLSLSIRLSLLPSLSFPPSLSLSLHLAPGVQTGVSRQVLHQAPALGDLPQQAGADARRGCVSPFRCPHTHTNTHALTHTHAHTHSHTHTQTEDTLC